ncbi:hypothetical protein RCC89_03160 [Cytophagaceae bacterium ABcell3]|nr:hypothetical protein RCC89_03160 [Cytophagaceae bacterium ABcell3]
MKKFLFSFFAIAFFSGNAFAQDFWGLGLRAGDPTGITAKRYMGNNALEINFGRTNMFYGRGWYDSRFRDWYRDQDYHYLYRDIEYRGHRGTAPISLQVHYLFHHDFLDVPGLRWYYGVGGQFRFQSFRYNYRYRYHNSNQWHYVDGRRVTNIDLGVDGVLGMEYTFADFPVSVFLDGNLFMELFDNPFLFHMQVGLGGRYNF